VPGSQQPTPLRDDHLDAHNGACRPLSSPTSNAASTLLGRVPNPLALQIRSGRTGDGDDRAVMTMRGGWLGMGEGGGGIGQRGGWLWRQVRRRRHWHSIDGIMRGRGHGDGLGLSRWVEVGPRARGSRDHLSARSCAGGSRAPRHRGSAMY
jgi:hypothetical protein